MTAYDEHAVRAFEVNAVDYLLKPVHPKRLAEAINRLSDAPENLPIEGATKAPLEVDDHLFLSTEERTHFFKVNAISVVEAAGTQSIFHFVDRESIVVTKPLGVWERRLPHKLFVRIHRSTIVNLTLVEEIERGFNYTYSVRIRGFEKPLAMSRRYASQLKTRLG